MRIEKANDRHRVLIVDFANACVKDSTENYKRALKDPDEYLDFLIARSGWSKESPEGWLPSTTYYAIENSQIVGAIRVRHGKNDTAENLIGYIGFETRPNYRRRGVGTILLSWITENVIENETVVTCEESNLASKGLLEKFGAEYISKSYDSDDQTYWLRYKIIPTVKIHYKPLKNDAASGAS